MAAPRVPEHGARAPVDHGRLDMHALISGFCLLGCLDCVGCVHDCGCLAVVVVLCLDFGAVLWGFCMHALCVVAVRRHVACPLWGVFLSLVYFGALWWLLDAVFVDFLWPFRRVDYFCAWLHHCFGARVRWCCTWWAFSWALTRFFALRADLGLGT